MTADDQKHRDKLDADKVYVINLLAAAQSRKYYGTLAIVMMNGEVKHIEKKETLLPPQ
jgi:uncharacterized membrane protein